jgi:hypothetical protein
MIAGLRGSMPNPTHVRGANGRLGDVLALAAP